MAEQEIITVESGTAIAIAEAEINQQVATARRFPRSEAQFYAKARALVLASDDSASECIYALPRDGKTIEGPSVRMAEILAYAWGNNRVAARIVDETERFITAQGVFHDLESNVARSVTVQRRITTSSGRRYGDDMIGVTANAAASIAMREAVLKGIPRAVWGDIYAQARALVSGNIENMQRRRDAAVKAFQLAGLSQEIMLKLVDKRGLKDIEPDDLITLRGVLTAIRDGDTSANHIARQYGEGAQSERADLSGKLRANQGQAPAESAPAETGSDAGDAKAAGKPQDGDPGAAAAEAPAKAAAPASEAPSQAEAPKGEEWSEEEAELRDKLAEALKKAASLDDVVAVTNALGPSFKGRSSAFTRLCNGMLDTRKHELSKAKSKAGQML